MFLGSLAYHMENEYMDRCSRANVPTHNLGYISGEKKNSYELIPLWEQFFSENSTITINEEINLWNSLTREKFLQKNSEIRDLVKDKLNAKRFLNEEINFVSHHFRTSEIRRQVIDDFIKITKINKNKWKRDIKINNFEYLLQIIKSFRNSSSHPGYILTHQIKWSNENLIPCLGDNVGTLGIKEFIKLFPYFLDKGLTESIISDIKLKLASLIINHKITNKQLSRLERHMGIYITDTK